MGARAKRDGFTLIELLVVISIIALLIAILLPALAAARNSAKDLQCLSNERQMGVLVHAYVEDSKGYLPDGFLAPPAEDSATWMKRLWKQAYGSKPYIGPSGVNLPASHENTFLACPRANEINADDYAERAALIPVFPTVKRNYGLNPVLVDFTTTINGIANSRTFARIESVTKATEAAIIGDVFSQSALGLTSVSRRHNSMNANILYVDGHAASSQLKEGQLSDLTYRTPFWRGVAVP